MTRTAEESSTPDRADRYDVVVVGGGAAGLSAALMLGRSRRSVLVVDAGEPRNAPAAQMHGFLSRDGVAPARLLEVGRAEVRGYGGRLLTGRVASAAPVPGGGFVVGIVGGRTVQARRLVLATGVVDDLPDVPGVRERWGRDVVHCPYCHGWEVRDRAIGILGGPFAVHQALLFGQLTSDLTLFLHTAPQPSEADAERLAARGVSVVPGAVAELVVSDDRLTGVRLAAGPVVPAQAVVVGPRALVRADVLVSLGLEPVEHPMGAGSYVAADPTGLTAVPGVWVAGNVADPMAQVLGAAAAGSRAGAVVNADLVTEDTDRAVSARRNRLARAVPAP